MKNISNTKWAFDTNILIYLLDKDSPYHAKTVNAVTLMQNQHTLPVISTQNSIEAINVLVNAYNIKTTQAITLMHDLIDELKFEIIVPLPTTINLFFELGKRNNNPKTIFDTFLAATIIDNNCRYLLTVNEKDFQNFKEIIVINPCNI